MSPHFFTYKLFVYKSYIFYIQDVELNNPQGRVDMSLNTTNIVPFEYKAVTNNWLIFNVFPTCLGLFTFLISYFVIFAQSN